MAGLLITQSGWTLTDTGACASPTDSSVEITSSTSVSPVVTGEKGETGPTGPKGEPGITGDAGLAGSGGVTGATDEPDETEDTVVGKTDGNDGAIVYFIMGSTGVSHAINIYVSHLRVIAEGVSTVQTNQLWQPFMLNGTTSSVSLISTVFSNGAWSVSSGSTT